MLIYSVCYYYGKNNKNNLKNHINEYQKINSDKTFVVTVCIDSHDVDTHNIIKLELHEFIVGNNVDNIVILTIYNWGGTIAALWYVYKYISSNYDAMQYDNIYVSHFEEDFYPKNNWYCDVKQLLDTNKLMMYIGESNKINKNNPSLGYIKHAINYRDITQTDILKHKYVEYSNLKTCGCGGNCISCGGILYGHQVWTDGGFYFSTIDRLNNIEKKIGIFHKGNASTKYDHMLDGVEFGEIGFPTLLFHNGFYFTAVYRDKYFINTGR